MGPRLPAGSSSRRTSPTDVIGSESTNSRGESLRAGPDFREHLLADEINRAPPRTQSALLEAMRRGTSPSTADDRCDARSCDGDAEPERAVGHLPAPRLAARPLPLQGAGSTTATRRTSSRCSRRPHRGVAPDMLEDVEPVLDGAGLQAVQRMLDAVTMPDDVHATSSRSFVPRAAMPACASVPARAAPCTSMPRPRRGRCSTTAGRRRPRTCRRWPSPSWATGCCCARRPRGRTSSATRWPPATDRT